MKNQSFNRSPNPLSGEIFTLIPGLGGRYELSNAGRVRSLYVGDSPRFTPYVMKPLEGRGHRGPTWRFQVGGRLRAVALDRLEEAVAMNRAPRMGVRRGSDHHGSVFGENEVATLRRTWANRKPRTGVTVDKIAEAQGVAPTTIRKIIHGDTWAHVEVRQ